MALTSVIQFKRHFLVEIVHALLNWSDIIFLFSLCDILYVFLKL